MDPALWLISGPDLDPACFIQIWKSLNATGTVRNFELLNIHISDLDPNPDPDSGRQVITDSSGIENQNWGQTTNFMGRGNISYDFVSNLGVSCLSYFYSTNSSWGWVTLVDAIFRKIRRKKIG